MDVLVGLDVSLASMSFCVLGEKGRIVAQAQIVGTPEALFAFTRDLPHAICCMGSPRSASKPVPCLNGGTGTGRRRFRDRADGDPAVKAALKAVPVTVAHGGVGIADPESDLGQVEMTKASHGR